MNNNTEHSRSVLLLEAIRAGIPTRGLVGALPDLRQNLIDTIDADLKELIAGNKVKGRVVWGNYGQGKTHFLKMIEKHILEQGFAVSFLTLNRDLGLNNLYNLFPALSSHILTHDASIPGLLNQLMESRITPQQLEALFEASNGISHPLPRLIFQSLLKYEARDLTLLYNALMGKKENITYAKQVVRTNQKHDYQNMPRFLQKDHLISFLEFFPLLLKSMGYRGWVILIDELEILGRMGRISRLNSYRNLSWLMNLGGEHNYPIYTIAASAESLNTDVFHGVKKHDADEMPRLAEERFDAKTALKIRDLFGLITGKQGMTLKPVKQKDIVPLLDTLLEIHREAIPWSYNPPENMVLDTIKRISPSDKPIRQIIRMFIETLDLYSTLGIIPGKFKEKLLEAYDFDEDLPETSDEANAGARGFSETSLKDMFDQ